MRRYILFFVATIIPLVTFAQTLYTPGPTNVNNTSGNYLEFNSNNLWNGTIRANGTGYTSFGLYESGGLKWALYQHPGVGSNLLFANSVGQDKFAFTQDGKFGIGVIAPSHALSVFSTSQDVLSVKSTSHSIIDIESGASLNSYIRFKSNSVAKWDIASEAGGNLRVYDYNSAATRLSVTPAGSVGINSPAPTTRLYIMEPWAGNTPDAAVANQGILVTGAATGGAINLGIDGNGTNGVPFFSWIQSRHRDQATYYSLSLNPMGGNIGIGTKNPVKKLHISGTGDVEQWIEATDNGFASLTLKSNGKQWHWSKRPSSAQDALHLYYNDGGAWSTPYMVFSTDGNIGIGTGTPDAKLAVKGNIHTQEVKVDLTGAVAPDYVFEKDYDLLSLSEVESFINQHKHLPEVPSAKQMEEEGLNLKEMNLILLKKVEELTLHLIQQQKEIEVLKSKVK